MSDMRSLPPRAAVLLLGLLAFAATPGAHAQTATDPADLAYWQSVQSSADPAEYQAYLDTFPNGRFAALARARLARLQAGGGTAAGGGGAAPIAIPGMTTTTRTPPTAPPPPPDPPADEVEEKITITPATPRVGQVFTVSCQNFPDPTSSDMMVIVPAGTPDMDPSRSQQDTKVVTYDYARNCKQNGSWKAGPIAPGRYEVRFMTTLYNNDRRFEARTRTAFSVR